MTEENAHRRRKAEKSDVVNEDLQGGRRQDAEFVARESPLTVLIDSSLHVKAIYHIFVVILLMLLCNTVIYDLVENGKVNIGLGTIANGFGDIRRGATLWLFELSVAIIFYPGLVVYAGGVKVLKKHSGLLRIWKVSGIIGVAGLQIALVLVPVWNLGRKYLEVGSSNAVTTEMFRFVMKIHAVTVACAPRCHDNKLPLPTLKHYVYFLFAPTLLYRDQYPRTKKIRWGVVMFHFMEVAAIIFYYSLLWERIILPHWSDYGKESKVQAGTIVGSMFACVLPGVISFLCLFYLVLHAWLNAFAEMLTFSDRLFYEDWWTSSQLSQYFQKWNLVVHSWIRVHIYKPLAPRAGRGVSTLTVFLVSAIAHEIIMVLSFGFFYPVLTTQFLVASLLMMPVMEASGRRFPGIFNLVIWFLFFLGNGLLWSLYPMEYFARKNCPPSDSDSFFIPKSWSCPEIILKPNWRFQNPLQILI